MRYLLVCLTALLLSSPELTAQKGQFPQVPKDNQNSSLLPKGKTEEPTTEEESPDDNTYVGLKKKLDGGFVTFPNDDIYFKYVEHYAITAGENDKLQIDIYNKERELVSNGTVENHFGVNWIKFTPKVQLPDEYYVLEVSGGNKGKKYYLRFTYD